jgi:hypothetical protein
LATAIKVPVGHTRGTRNRVSSRIDGSGRPRLRGLGFTVVCWGSRCRVSDLSHLVNNSSNDFRYDPSPASRVSLTLRDHGPQHGGHDDKRPYPEHVHHKPEGPSTIANASSPSPNNPGS